MNFRTDLAIERHQVCPHKNDGLKFTELSCGDAKITRIQVIDENGEKQMQKPIGNYITVETPRFFNYSDTDSDHLKALKNELNNLLPKNGTVLVCGIGNTEITPDALGPKAAARILATRHITGEIAKSAGLGDLRAVAVVAPGVLGQTGMELSEILIGIIDKIKPAAVIAIDALASRRLGRLGCTVQLSDTGITPGSGVGNARAELSSRTLGVPVISVGVPTVVDAQTLVRDITENQSADIKNNAQMMMVTPREIDMLIDRAAQLIAHAINCTLQPHIDPEDLLMLV
ncbi:MAG: GPR endopeptidase [Clostridia bacterium]|nr:GPR endopeptidase [Clostridia bacterium]